MFIIYDLIFLVIAVIYLPVYLFKRKFHKDFLRRLGILPKELKLNRPIWIHAVSVGEAMAMRGLLEKLRASLANKTFVISTVTATGNKIAKTLAKKCDFVTYLPLDLSFCLKPVINRINPCLFIIAETELWPNLISYLKRKNIPIIIVNGRISDSSFKGYRLISFFIRPFLRKVSLFCVQTKVDAQRLISLGVDKNKIEITGNMKFDIKDYTDDKKDYTDDKLKLGLKSTEKLFVAGSTHSGEEEIILEAYKELLVKFPYLKLLIAPRHPERATQITNLITKFDFLPLRISSLGSLTGQEANKPAVFILDTVGQLLSFYNIADIVFVGASLVKKGGHNILEPASLGRPVIIGAYMFNFRDMADLFLENHAVLLINNKEELKTAVTKLLNNPQEAMELGWRGKDLILNNQGATQRNIKYIISYATSS